MKKIIKIALFVLFAAAVTGLMGFIYVEQGKQHIKQVVIKINREGEKGFLNKEAIKRMVDKFDSLPNKKVNQINIQTIESAVNKNPFVEIADVFINIDKDLVINIEEKRAFLRIFNRKNDGFYIDHSGNIFPLSSEYTPRVLIASGYIDAIQQADKISIYDSVYSNTHLVDLFELTRLINENKFLAAQIGQIYVNSRGEFDMVPLLGNHIIKFGTMEDAKTKLGNLDTFYKKALLGEGWEKYAIINLKYKNQVICKRK